MNTSIPSTGFLRLPQVLTLVPISKYNVDLPPAYRWHSRDPISMHHPL